MFLSLCYQFIFYVLFRLGNLHSFQSCKSQKWVCMCDLIFWSNAKWKAPNVMGYVSWYVKFFWNFKWAFAHISLWMIKLNDFVTSGIMHKRSELQTNMLQISVCHIFLLETLKVGDWLHMRKKHKMYQYKTLRCPVNILFLPKALNYFKSPVS